MSRKQTPPYRRRKGSDTWHWFCPTGRRELPDDVVKKARPKGDLCNWCKAIERRRQELGW